MGQVYRAIDTTLGRQVAIKILPDALASDAERMARFEREAKTLASLNHPGIAAVYGFEKSSGLHALVMMPRRRDAGRSAQEGRAAAIRRSTGRLRSRRRWTRCTATASPIAI
jgi:hypothetical protein